jgi:putative DNA primase/helicase
LWRKRLAASSCRLKAKWLEYTAERGWVRHVKIVPPAARELASAICIAVANSTPGLRPKARLDLASASKASAVVRAASSSPALAAPAYDAWDADLYLLNTPGGIVDLRTGAMRPRTPADLFLHC